MKGLIHLQDLASKPGSAKVLSQAVGMYGIPHNYADQNARASA